METKSRSTRPSEQLKSYQVNKVYQVNIVKEFRITKGVHQNEIYRARNASLARWAGLQIPEYGYCKRLNDGWTERGIVRKLK